MEEWLKKMKELFDESGRTDDAQSGLVSMLLVKRSELQAANYTPAHSFPGTPAMQKKARLNAYYSVKQDVKTLAMLIQMGLGVPVEEGSLNWLWPWEQQWRNRSN
jgi:hypothetical protein